MLEGFIGHALKAMLPEADHAALAAHLKIFPGIVERQRDGDLAAGGERCCRGVFDVENLEEDLSRFE